MGTTKCNKKKRKCWTEKRREKEREGERREKERRREKEKQGERSRKKLREEERRREKERGETSREKERDRSIERDRGGLKYKEKGCENVTLRQPVEEDEGKGGETHMQNVEQMKRLTDREDKKMIFEGQSDSVISHRLAPFIYPRATITWACTKSSSKQFGI